MLGLSYSAVMAAVVEYTGSVPEPSTGSFFYGVGRGIALAIGLLAIYLLLKLEQKLFRFKLLRTKHKRHEKKK